MEIFYFISSLFGFYYFLFNKRYFDLFTLAFLSQQVYFLPCLVQFFVGENNNFHFLVPEVFFIGSLIINFLIIFSLNINIKSNFTNVNGNGENYFTFYATLLALLSFIYCYVNIGEILFTGAKADVLNSIDRFYVIWSTSSLLGFCSAYLLNKKIYFFINLGLILLTVYIGFRSFAVIAIISIILMFFLKRPYASSLLKDYYKIFLLGLFSFFFFLFYKGIYIAIKFKDYERVFNNLTNSDFYYTALSQAEPFGIQMILSDVISYNFFIGMENFKRIILTFIVFGDSIGIDTKTFNDYFQPALYGNVGYGMGSNIWAHIYSSGGWILLILFICFFCIIIRFFSKKVYSVSTHYKSLWVVLSCYWVFYIHRNDLFYQLGLEKRVIIVFFMVAFLAYSTHFLMKGFYKKL